MGSPQKPSQSHVGTTKSWGSDYTADTRHSSYSLHNQPIEEVEEARLRPQTNEEFPWLEEEYEPIRAAGTRRPPQWFQDGQSFNRMNSTARSNRSFPRESIVDLHLIVSDLDYYAGAVHDYQHSEYDDEFDELDEESAAGGHWPLPENQNNGGEIFGHVRMDRKGSKAGSMVRRGASVKSSKEKDTNLVTWDGPAGPPNPKNWSRRRKWMATITVSLFTFISPVSSSMIAPALSEVQADLHIQSDLLTQLAMSVFILGFALGPLFLGPLSEIFGRRIVLQVSGLFYLVFNLAGGFSQNSAELIAFRFLSGLGGSAPLGIGGGVLADIWMPQERGKAMALYSLMPLLGPALGPIAGGFIAEYSTWRWVFWSTTIVAVIVQIMGVFYLHETYAATLLARKKRALIRASGNAALHTEFDNPSRSFTTHMAIAFKRPFILLFSQPIVQVLALYIGYVYGVLYLVLASFPEIWGTIYAEDAAISGLNYISLGIGFFLGTQIAAQTADRIYQSLRAKNGDVGRSEFRVPLMFPGAIMVPVGLVIYGWAAQYHTHWIIPNIGAAIFAAGNQLVFQNCQTYLVDAYTRYAASAIAATAVFRSLGGFAFPLFAPYMYGALGYGWGNTTLAFIGVAIGLPCPFVLWWYGETLRKKSTFAAG